MSFPVSSPVGPVRSVLLLCWRDTGHPHPHRDAALNNYDVLLQQMGRSEAEIAVEVQAVRREAGLG